MRRAPGGLDDVLALPHEELEQVNPEGFTPPALHLDVRLPAAASDLVPAGWAV